MKGHLRRRLLALLLAALPSCTGLNFFSEAQENALGVEAYAESLKGAHEIRAGADFEMVQRVGRAIAAASGKDYDWEFKLIDSELVNAFCLPGGKIAVYTGILPITQDEDGLAAVLGHEVAHATERHGGKRMTQAVLLQATLAAAAAGLSMSKMNEEQQLGLMAAFGLGAQVGVALPFGRGHEEEADLVGLRYAIRAGYDPYAAVGVWERMAQLGSGGPEWLSTHPAPESRSRRLAALIPQLLREEGAGKTP